MAQLLSTNVTGYLTATGPLTANSVNVTSQLQNLQIFQYNPANYGTIDPTGTNDSSPAFQLAVNAINALNGRAYLTIPPGVYKVNSNVIVFTTTNPVMVTGADRGITVIIPNTTTGDIVRFAGGSDGVSLKNMSIFQTGTPQLNGAGANTNGASDVLIENVQFVNLFNDVAVVNSSIKVDITHTIHSQTSGQANSVGIYVNNGFAGDTYIGPDVIHTNTGSPRRFAAVMVQASRHFELNQANLTGANTALLIQPGTNQNVTYGFINHTLFDSCNVDGALITSNIASGNINSIFFNQSWFCGSVTGTGANGCTMNSSSTGVINGIVFNNCRAYNNQKHGFAINYGTDIHFLSCDSKGNGQAASNTYDGLNFAAGVSNWKVLGGKYGGTTAAPTGGNQRYGINIQAGATSNAVIIAADCIGNIIGPINNGATGLITIRDVIGMPMVPASTIPATLVTNAITYVTPQFYIPAGSLQVGAKYRFKILVTNSASAETCTVTVKFGTAGTTADTSILATALGAGTAAAGTAEITVECYIKTLSPTAGAILTTLKVEQTGTTGFTNQALQYFQVTTSTLNTTVNNFLGVCLTPSVTNVVTVQAVGVEIVGGRG